MVKFGIKEITSDNWLEQDEALKGFARFSPDGQIRPLVGDDYLRDILAPRLLETIPENVQKLFEVARGAMIYGYFFYPLYTLATEQLLRVAEAAVTHKCNTLGGPKPKKPFDEKLKWLLKEKIINDTEYERLDGLRHVRNETSHPKDQMILTPGNTVGILERITQQINFLFS